MIQYPMNMKGQIQYDKYMWANRIIEDKNFMTSFIISVKFHVTVF